MRYYATIEEAYSEIKRDIYKSPIITSSRVQNVIGNQQLHEAMDYSYAVNDIPTEPQTIIALGHSWQMWPANQIETRLLWLQQESRNRLMWVPGEPAEYYHPELRRLLGGYESQPMNPDYTYTDRLRGGLEAAALVLGEFPDTRRAYIPIFIPEDSVRASASVRIPCSLGYQPLVRWIDEQPYLHLTYMERACDFDRFWLTDIYLARMWQLQLIEMLNRSAGWLAGKRLKCGNTTHFITSLHSFIEGEVY